MKPDPKDILAEARRLKDERYNLRNKDLAERKETRFRKRIPVVPEAYKDTATIYTSPKIEEEGRQAAALIYALPVVHVPPPKPEDQPLTTKAENFLSAMFQELESVNGSVWWKNAQAQLHSKISWIYFGMKRKPYEGQPAAPDEGASPATLLGYSDANAEFKKEAGIASVFDYRHVPTETMYIVGNYRSPLAVYEVKEVDERELMLQYDLKKDDQGRLVLTDGITTLPSGYPEYGTKSAARKVMVVEYWDRDWCVILLQNTSARWQGSPKSADALVLDEWEHGWGRVPYFGAPAFENEVMEEEYKYESPLDALYAEIPEYNNRRTMYSNVAYLKGYPAWQDMVKDNSDAILDDAGNIKAFLKFKPGEIAQMPPGHQVMPIPMETGQELFNEILAMEQRISQFSLSDVTRGVSPGADTANSAITQLRRLQRSSLSPINKNQADQAREMFRFALERVKGENGEGIGETVFVYAPDAGEMIGLGPDDIVTLNLQCKVAPDTGQDMLIEEKQAAELFLQGLISEIEFHERRGKENPEEFVSANVIQRLWMTMETDMQTQIKAALGNSGAIAQLVAARQQGGSAADAVPGVLQQIQQQNTGMGSGSPGMPRDMGVRSPAVAQTTQPQGGVGPFQ